MTHDPSIRFSLHPANFIEHRNMTNLLISLFGQGSDLSAIQMVARGIVLFLLTLFMLRVSGRRSFGQHTPFDACITVLLGSILARAVVGASPFLPTVATGVALVLLHRALAMLIVRIPAFDALISGTPRNLLWKGRIDPVAARKGLVSEADIRQALREHAQMDNLADARQVTLERNGIVSVVKR